MSDIVFLLIGFALGVVFSALSVRRAKKKPEGKTAKAVNVIFGGGGPGSGQTPK